jgi:hypothetical protein
MNFFHENVLRGLEALNSLASKRPERRDDKGARSVQEFSGLGSFRERFKLRNIRVEMKKRITKEGKKIG